MQPDQRIEYEQTRLAYLNGVGQPFPVHRCVQPKRRGGAPVAGLVVVILGIHLNEVVSHALNLIGATTAGLACFVTGLVLSAQPLRLDATVGVGVFLKNILLPLLAYATALALGMSGE